MKLYAQHGYGPGDKLSAGVAAGVVDGVVFGAKDMPPVQLPGHIAALQQARASTELLFDPHYYACGIPRHADNRLGKLEDYPYWGNVQRNAAYFLNQRNIEADIRACVQFQSTLPLYGTIAPNILIRHGLNSREGTLASSFINLCAGISRDVQADRRVFATLALSREALIDSDELEQFVHLITSLSDPPDGFYVLLALAGPAATEVFHATVVANLLFLVSSLKLNGFEVIVGYSDLMGPILAAAEADAGCSGWFSTLRMFSLNRFEPSSGGGKPPRPVYLSMRLFNRILVSELDLAYTLDPAVRNGLPTDAPYFQGGAVSEPNNKAEECLQSWEALRILQQDIGVGPREARVDRVITMLQDAHAAYEALRRQGLVFETKSSDSHLNPAIQGIRAFQATL
jgi:hypothetical protein